jgi:uncharacterized membrane protein YgcG
MMGGGKGKMLALGAGALGLGAAGAGAVNALSDSPQAQAAGTSPEIPGDIGDRFSSIVDRFANVVSKLFNMKNEKSKGSAASGGGGQTSGGPGGGDGGPGGGGPGKGVNAGDITADTAEEKAFIATVREAEGTAGPKGKDTFFGSTQFGGDLSTKTVNEVVELQKQYLKDPRSKFWNAQKGKWDNSAAVGIGQWLEPGDLVKQMGLDPSKEKFTEEFQNKMLLFMAKQRGVDVMNMNEEQMRKANKVWAGLGPEYGQTKRTINQSMKMYKENLQEARTQTKAKPGVGGPETPDFMLPPEKRNQYKNLATNVSQPPPSQQQQQPVVMSINLGGGGQKQSGGGSSGGGGGGSQGSGPSVPFLPAGNPDNFLVLYSRMVYNIVDG